jgi:DNA-binding MarR family transcriptional regulator
VATPGREAGVAKKDRTVAGQEGGGPLSPLIHGRARLLILSFLLRAGMPQPFTAVRRALQFTDGALSVHLAKLEQGGLILQQKTFEGKKPLTVVKVTDRGKREFQAYVADLQTIVPGLGTEDR